jgi:hypothetical protein
VLTGQSHDAGYTMRELVNWMVAPRHRRTRRPLRLRPAVRRRGAPPANVPAPAAALISRYAPVATVMNDFYWNLFGDSRTTPYPARQIKHAMSSDRHLNTMHPTSRP